MAAIQMLNELTKLKAVHSSHKQQLAACTLQPNIEQQKQMIVRNVSQRLVVMAIKRESTKFLFDQKMKLEEEMRRKSEDDGSLSPEAPSLSRSTSSRRTMTAPLRRGSSMGGSRKIVSLSNIGRMKSDLGHPQRPSTTMSTSSSQSGGFRSVSGKVEDFVRSIKTASNPEDFQSELEDQLVHRAKDATKVFDIICRNMKMGAVCQFQPRRLVEEIDLSAFSTTNHPMEKVTKLEDLATFRKKDGMLIYFDPATNTYAHQVTLRVTYLKPVDIGEEQSVTKEYTFRSDGNYYGLHIVRDNRAHTGLQALLQDDEEGGKKVSLPGWQGRPPLFFPVPIVSLSIVRQEDYAQAASLAYNLSRLRLFAISCPNPKAGLRRLQEFLDQQLLIEMANITVFGGLSAMHLACLHGNLQAVQTLVSTGANINHRCRGDHHYTALHEAVIGGQTMIVRYLLSEGASQTIIDDAGRCPLHYACQLGHVTITRLLLDGAGGRRALLIEDKGGLKPIDLAATNFLKNCVEGKPPFFVAWAGSA